MTRSIETVAQWAKRNEYRWWAMYYGRLAVARDHADKARTLLASFTFQRQNHKRQAILHYDAARRYHRLAKGLPS